MSHRTSSDVYYEIERHTGKRIGDVVYSPNRFGRDIYFTDGTMMHIDEQALMAHSYNSGFTWSDGMSAYTVGSGVVMQATTGQYQITPQPQYYYGQQLVQNYTTATCKSCKASEHKGKVDFNGRCSNTRKAFLDKVGKLARHRQYDSKVPRVPQTVG